jgi:acylpyruvate hydrolase
MKIICVGRNYAAHIEELHNEKPTQPIIFTKPDTALLRQNAPFYLPDFSSEIHFECEVVVRICREGKHIDPGFAHKYYDQVGLGVDFTARDLQNELTSKGLPWDLAKGFDGAAVISSFVSKDKFADLQKTRFQLMVNGVLRQDGDTSLMLFPIDEIVSFISRFFTLKTGDFIYTGTPKGVAKVVIGDRLEGFLEGEKMFDFEVK